MRKKIIQLMGVLIFAAILLINLSLSFNSDVKTKTELKNIEALACYSVESKGSTMWFCCYPWIPNCYASDGVNFSGTIIFP